MDSVLVISPSTLMHASLAYLSIELRTMDSIMTSQSSNLPLEILLLIRAYLVVGVTEILVVRSSSALSRYEKSLRCLLCASCLAYNQDVYGDDVWDWEQFSGACACFATEYRSISFHPPTLNPKFYDRQHWLEFYLSKKALRLIQNSCSSQSLANDSQVIWDLVSSVLQNYGCQSLCTRHTSRNPTSSIRNRNEPSSVLVVPREGLVYAAEESCIVLKRVERDLALSVEYPAPVLATSSPSTSMASSRGLSLDYGRADHCSSRAYGSFSEVVNTIFFAALSLPLSIITLFLTIVCFYSRPLAFRIL